LRCLMFVLSLIAALAGTPLRMAEAAHDFACTQAESGAGDVMEVPDGGVGDDSDATIKPEITNPPDNMIGSLSLLPGDASLILSPACRVVVRLTDPPVQPTAALPRRLAWLQSYLC
jgi:hypothetical protein